MSELEIQKHLRGGGTADDLLARYGITAKRHRAHGNLVLFKYNQIASPMHERIVRECRGIILDEANGWSVVARAFDKFFNHGEGHAASLDWSTARVQEKVDGSLCVLYEYAGSWHVATTGTPDAGGDVNGTGVIFADLFWDTLHAVGGRVPEPAGNPAEHTFYFELTGPANRIVVMYDKPRLTLLGSRHRETGAERRPHEVAPLFGGIPPVQEYPLTSFDEILASFGSISPLSQEGYVVVDGAFNRVKVKHPGYVALHHAKDGLSQRAFVEIARSGETPEVIAAFPELKPSLDEARSRLDVLVAEVESDFDVLRDIVTQKDFAMKATKKRCPAALFAVRAGKSPSVREHFAGVHIDQLMRLLGYKTESAAP